MYSQIVGMVLFFLGLNLLFSYLHVFLKIFGDLHIKMQKTTCYCCALCNSKLRIRYVYTQRTRILCNFFYCCKMGFFLSAFDKNISFHGHRAKLGSFALHCCTSLTNANFPYHWGICCFYKKWRSVNSVPKSKQVTEWL